MDEVTVTISNNTNFSVELFIKDKKEALLPNSSRPILAENNSTVHGHSNVGSFALKRDYDGKFHIDSWLNLVIMQKEKNNSIIFEILKKSKRINT
jgi:hypothetical protein